MAILEKISKIFFHEEEEEETSTQEYASDSASPALKTKTKETNKTIWQEPVAKKKRRNNLVSIPGAAADTDIVLIKAESYGDMQGIAKHIKERRVVVVNFEELDKAVAQRMVDFLSGAVFALDGVPKKVSGGTFLFSSNNIKLTGQIMESEHDSKKSEDTEVALRSYSSWKN